ncbi:MAG: hypothetical protein JXR96_01725 [Deltaproteobacteria bacterium]|nr:hypothetical protein [Deltaproteobacteria bacterium]
MSDQYSLQRAVHDLAMIRKAIERAHSADQTSAALRSALRAKFIIQSISLLLALALALAELASGHVLSRGLMLLSPDWEEGMLGIAQVGVMLATCIMALYFIVWRSSRYGEQEFSRFIAANFQYLRSFSLLSDLLVKFIVFSLVVLAPRPEWVAPLLVVFTADYLFQGRYFNLPIRLSLALGVVCLAVAAVLYLTETVLLMWPLLVFALINGLSLLVHIRTWNAGTRDRAEVP